MKTLNLLTIELQLRVEGSNNYHHFLLKKCYLFFKARFKIFL